MLSLFRMRTKTQVCEMKSFNLVSWLNHIELLIQLNWKKIQIFMFSMIVLLMLTQRSLSSTGQANVDENDDHIEDCDEGDDYSIDDKE